MGQVMAYVRELRGLTFEQMEALFDKADKLGRTTLWKTEKGENHTLRNESIKRIADVLGIKRSVLLLLSDVDDPDDLSSDAAKAVWDMIYGLLTPESRVAIIANAILVEPTSWMPDSAADTKWSAEYEGSIDWGPLLPEATPAPQAQRALMFKVPDDDYYYDPNAAA